MAAQDKFFETPMGKLLLFYENQKKVHPLPTRHHGLKRKLIVSLTSYGPRFKWLHLTIRSILEQTVHPDVIVLWISEEEIGSLPDSVNELGDAITIQPTKNLFSYKKIIPTLRMHHDAHIVICDDDIYYPRHWLEDLVRGFEENRKSILGHMIHRFHFLPNGELAPYYDWSFDVQDNRARRRSSDTIAVGVGGVFYPSGSLHPDVTDEALFGALCPKGDDLWLFVMSRLNGFLPVKVGSRLQPIFWPETQSVGMFKDNMYRGGNDDIAISRLKSHYGDHIFEAATTDEA